MHGGLGAGEKVDGMQIQCEKQACGGEVGSIFSRGIGSSIDFPLGVAGPGPHSLKLIWVCTVSWSIWFPVFLPISSYGKAF